ncbi:MAG: cytochrome c oxidase subunit II [Burkholderiales bacterium]|nr:MAG: cytochrome c oxidase subunit II [Burkholderiales bacterium]
MQTIVALDPQGPFAQPLSDLSWLLITAMFAVLAIVIVLTLLAVFARNTVKRLIAKPGMVIIGGLAFPTIVLTGLLVWSLGVTDKVAAKPEPTDLRIRVTGEMWWWRVHYLEGDRVLFETANEIHIPVGRTVAFELASNDVIHSFWIPQLGGKMDMVPGRVNMLRLQADAAGVYRGQCSEYCGAAHALMAMEVVAQPEADYQAWAASQAEPARNPSGPGLDAFAASGCGACHAVRGTTANGMIGPDLTHVGSRRTIAAGILPNDKATLTRFIKHAGELKPGLRMPDYDRLPQQDVEAIADWLHAMQSGSQQ